MRNANRKKLLASTVLIGLAAFAAPAYAQDAAAQDTATSQETEESSEIIVTGSRVARVGLDGSNPVSVVTSEELNLRQTAVAEEFLRQLPSAVPSIGSAVNNGNGGASFVNLRGIGLNRNLVLLDGRRFTPADTTGAVDLNNIPLAVIERTEILTGGATTTYGADAVSGVVNFITRRDFAGLEANFSNQITEEGDGNVFRAEVTIGANFDDGRGNAVFSVGYQEADAVFQGDRPFSVENISAFTGEAGGSSAAVPAVIVGGGATGQINPEGTDVVPGQIYDFFNFNPFNIFQTPFERFNIYGAARYEVSDAIEVFTQGVFSKQTVSTIIAPGGTFFNTYNIPLSNPFLPVAIRDRFCAGASFDAATCVAAANATGPDDPAYREIQAQVRRRSVEAGTRDSNFTTTLFNYTLGARGGITDTINWEISGGYGESENIQEQTGFARLSRLQQSIRASDPGACHDPTNGCVPINLFGPAGTITQDQVDFVFSQSQLVINRATFAQAQALISGDFGWGISKTPIGFAVGAEFREYTASQQSDDASKTPGEVVGGGGAAPDIFGSYNVYDYFGEVVVPLLENVAFAESLTVEGGLRYSDYSTAGGELTWKAGGTWEPVSGARIRGNYQRSSRAPNIGELFTPVTTGLDNLATDPCQGNAPVGNAALAAVCIAQGAPAAIVNAGGILAPAAGQINTTTGGNLDLGVETATTWTIGAAVEPFRGFSFTVDYFNIKVEDAITAPGVGDVLDGCYLGALDFNSNTFCQLIQRNPFTGGLDGAPNEAPGLLLNLSNLGLIETDGIDVGMRYQRELTDNLVLNLSFDGTWTNKNTFQAFEGALNRDCVGFYSVNCPSIQPEFAWTQRTSLTLDDRFTASLFWRFLSSVEYEPVQLAADLDADAAPLEEFRSIPAESYFDLTFRWMFDDNVQLNFLVQNLFNNQPKVVGSDVGSTAFNSGNVYPSTYDALGRRFTAAVKFTF